MSQIKVFKLSLIYKPTIDSSVNYFLTCLILLKIFQTIQMLSLLMSSISFDKDRVNK